MNTTEYWNKRYKNGGNSGYGSYDEQLTKKLHWLSGLDIKSIAEVGCGDFNFGKNLMELYPNVSYYAQDISSEIIVKNVHKYPKPLFTTNIAKLPDADLLLCIDVLFHVLDNNEYLILLTNLHEMWTKTDAKYLAITAYENEQEAAPHLKIRKFDPSYFGKPIIREVVEEDGQMIFYLWKK